MTTHGSFGRFCVALVSALGQFLRGMRASVQLTDTFRLLANSKSSRKRIWNIIVLNLALVAIDAIVSKCLPQTIAHVLCIFVLGEVPAGVQAYIQIIDATSSLLLFALAVVPLLLASVIFSGRWIRQIVASASHQSRSREGSGSSLATVGEALFQTSLLLVMTLQAALLDLFPILGRSLAIALTAAIMGFNAFDSGRWAVDSAPVMDRLATLEASWPWFMGFGALPALLSYFGSVGNNMAVYGITFPFLVLAALGSGSRGYGPPPLTKQGPIVPLLFPFKWSVLHILRLINWIWQRRRPFNAT